MTCIPSEVNTGIWNKEIQLTAPLDCLSSSKGLQTPKINPSQIRRPAQQRRVVVRDEIFSRSCRLQQAVNQARRCLPAAVFELFGAWRLPVRWELLLGAGRPSVTAHARLGLGGGCCSRESYIQLRLEMSPAAGEIPVCSFRRSTSGLEGRGSDQQAREAPKARQGLAETHTRAERDPCCERWPGY